MKLTNYLRDAFVNRVLQDVPVIDYTEKIRSRAMEHAVGLLPVLVQQVWREYPGMIATEAVSCTLGKSREYFYWYLPFVDKVPLEKSLVSDKTLNEWADLYAEQREKIAELTAKCRAAARACTTTQSLRKQFPEFDKYIPTDNAPTGNLPATTNLVADLVKAGWPKKAAA